jgi:hypothetical protein
MSEQQPATAMRVPTERAARRARDVSRAGLRAISESGHWARLMAKAGAHLFRKRLPFDRKALLFILGCQRSGTTLMTRIFERDWDAWVFHESSRLSSDDPEHRMRLNELAKVKAVLAAANYPLLVAKPLVESQQARRLLEYFPHARVLWLYRHYHDVVASDLNRFGLHNGIHNLRPIVECDQTNWRAQNVDAATRSTIQTHFRDDMNPYDAAALFWFCRNMHYLEGRLDDASVSDRVMLLRYEELVQNPDDVMRRVYRFVGRPFPGPGAIGQVHDRSVAKGHGIPLSPEIAAMCESLLDRLDALAHYRQQKVP